MFCTPFLQSLKSKSAKFHRKNGWNFEKHNESQRNKWCAKHHVFIAKYVNWATKNGQFVWKISQKFQTFVSTAIRLENIIGLSQWKFHFWTTQKLSEQNELKLSAKWQKQLVLLLHIMDPFQCCIFILHSLTFFQLHQMQTFRIFNWSFIFEEKSS